MTDRAGTNSSGGVRNLLARFEAKTENTPPPSRGRSPVSSERGRSTSSRPLSKVRTSFVAVERSGQMGPMLGVRKLSEEEMTLAANGLGDTKDAAARSEDGPKQDPMANGLASVEAAHPTAALPNVAEEETSTAIKENSPALTDPEATETSVASPMASKDEPEGPDSANASEASPLARKSVAVDTTSNVKDDGGTKKANDVGSILKGSPFEDDSQLEVNGSPKKDTTVKTSPKKVVSPKKLNAQEKSDQTAVLSPNGKHPASKTTASRPSPISMKKDSTKKEGATSSKPPLSAKSSESKNSPKVSSAPKTPSTSSSREPAAKTTSPRQPAPKASPKAVSKDKFAGSKTSGEALKSGRAPLTNGSTSASVKPPTSTSDPTKKPASVPSKPQPKSPTRPVRLPAAATSSTAASAAKVGGAPSRSPRRASTTTTARKAPVPKKDMPASKAKTVTNAPSATAPVRRKVSRPSLPPQSLEPNKPNKSNKPRTSITPDEGFLARMMRPTAASASKVNEKVETKSPPRKTSGTHHPISHTGSHAMKPKRKSEIKGGIKEEDKEATEDKKADEAVAAAIAGSVGKDNGAVQPGGPGSTEATTENHAVDDENLHAELSESNGDQQEIPQPTEPAFAEPVTA